MKRTARRSIPKEPHRWGDPLENPRGFVLVTSLLFMTLLSIMGTAAYLTTSNELKISSNYQASRSAHYVAEGGVEEARARLRGGPSSALYAGDPALTPDQWWSAYILSTGDWNTTDDPGYDGNFHNYVPTAASHTSTTVAPNSLQGAISYLVRIRHKTEYLAETGGHTATNPHYYDADGSTAVHTAGSPGNIVYYGYGNPATPLTALQFTTSGLTEHRPVEIITALGRSGGSLKMIEAEVVRLPPPVVKAAIYAKGNVTGNGTSLTVDGNDNCGVAAPKPPVYTLSPSSTLLNGVPTMLGNPPNPTSGPDDVDIWNYVNALKGTATHVITADINGATYGDAGNFVTCYSDTFNPFNVMGLKLNNVTGYGILLVSGDLTLGGGFVWNGLILVTGTLVFNGGGAGINIKGAVLANQTVDMNGGIDVKYDSCMVDNSMNNQSLKVLSWKEVR